MPHNFANLTKLGMGNAKSKRKGLRSNKASSSLPSGGNKDPRHEATRDHDFSADMHERWAEDHELKIMRRTIDRDPEIFVLNNLMMCVQFFENYDEEISKIRKSFVSARETDLNSRLPSQTHTLIPDVLQEHVAKRVDFTYMLPTFKHTIELLQPIRIYVVFDNIEVTEENDMSPYSSVNETITYSMQLKPSPNHKGYIQLQYLEVNPPKKTASVDDLRLPPVTIGTRDEVYSDGDSIYSSKFRKDVGASITGKPKNVRDFSNDDGVFEHHRLRGQERHFDSQRNNQVKDDKPEVSSIEDETHRDEGAATRKEIDPRRDRTRNTGKQYGKTKLMSPETGSPAGSTSSGYRSGTSMEIYSDYSYAETSYNGTTPKESKSSLEESTVAISSTELPRQCFKKIKYRGDGKIYDARRERKPKMSIKDQRIWQAYQNHNYDVWYLNSTKFMKYFCQIFTDQLAIPMGFDPDISESAQGSVIYRDKVELLDGTMSTKLETFEIVPCVSSPWPECAQEWIDRPRTSWPHFDVIEKIKEFRCHMIPEGPINEKGINKFEDLEWKLIFPAAERFLETCLTYPQVRVYLIGLMLHKTFIRPADSVFGLTTSHIKNRLFWMIEEDDRPAKWMENRTGEALMRLLNSLYRSISQDEPHLPDFFIKEKNLFQERAYLLRTQKQLKRIIENPVMYVFHAMENIRHSSKFFPRLNYEELLRILMADSLTLVNPALVPQMPSIVGGGNSSEKDYDHVRGFWDEVKQKTNDKPILYPKKSVINKSLINPRKAYDQVVEIPIRCARMEPRRLSALMDFFIKHFMKMAEYCHTYGATPQKTAYIEQAERLAVLLSEYPSHIDEAKLYLEKLCTLKRRVANTRLRYEPPETPRRNPDMPVFAKPMKERYQANEILEERTPASGTDDEDADQQEAGPVPLTTKLVVHERGGKEPDNLPSSDDVTLREKESGNAACRPKHLISLATKTDASHLSETTYI